MERLCRALPARSSPAGAIADAAKLAGGARALVCLSLGPGQRPPSRPLLVCAEQGVGDEHIFLSYLPDLLRQVSDVIVECNPRNVSISAACGVPTIQLECSYLTLTSGRGALFGNLYPYRDTD